MDSRGCRHTPGLRDMKGGGKESYCTKCDVVLDRLHPPPGGRRIGRARASGRSIKREKSRTVEVFGE